MAWTRRWVQSQIIRRQQHWGLTGSPCETKQSTSCSMKPGRSCWLQRRLGTYQPSWDMERTSTDMKVLCNHIQRLHQSKQHHKDSSLLWKTVAGHCNYTKERVTRLLHNYSTLRVRAKCSQALGNTMKMTTTWEKEKLSTTTEILDLVNKPITSFSQVSWGLGATGGYATCWTHTVVNAPH